MLNLAREFARKGISVDLVLVDAVGPYVNNVPGEIRVINLNKRRALASVAALVRYLRTEKPGALISALHQANFSAVLAKGLARVPTKLVMTVHNTMSEETGHSASWKNRMIPYVSRMAFPFAEEIVTVSRGVAEDLSKLLGLPLDRLHVIYNPVVGPELFEKAKLPIDHKWFREGQVPVLVAIGRFTVAKDFTTLIRAIALVASRRPARLMILGEGEERPVLESLVRELGLEDSVLLPGFVDNPYAYLARAKMFVLSSLHEGLPTVLIEALALGKPIVSTDCRSGPREILQNGAYGRLVPVGNAEALANAIEGELVEGPRDVPDDAWRIFTVENAVNRYLSLMRDIECRQSH
jgi:glycosyltransferase involved in cell wall biosynthesis